MKLDPDGWMALYTEGILAASNRRWDVADSYLQQCLKLDPEFPKLHYWLGNALYHEGKLADARDEYRKYLSGRTEDGAAEAARRSVIQINQELAKPRFFPPRSY